MTVELGLFHKQALIERLTQRFAELNGYKIEPNIDINNAQHPQIKTWTAMATVAVEEVEQEIVSFFKGENIQNLADLDEDTIDELIDDLNDAD